MSGEIALYVHWPFCKSKCPYCDFNSHVRAGIDDERWRKALLRELDHYAALAPGRLVSVFFGGGTPSLMAPETAAAVLERAAHHWPHAPDIEITLEANPTSVEAGRLADFRAAGVKQLPAPLLHHLAEEKFDLAIDAAQLVAGPRLELGPQPWVDA